MNLAKIILPTLLATACLSGCVYEEVTYEEPRRVYHGGYAPREVVVVEREPAVYYNQPRSYPYSGGYPRGSYHQAPPRVYHTRPFASIVHDNHHHHGESSKERHRRELREAERAHEKHKKEHDKKKKKKKKDDDD